MKNFCLYIHTPLEKRNYERLGISLFLSRNFKVKLIDLTDVLYPAFRNHFKVELSDFRNIVSPKKSEQVHKIVEEHKDWFGIVFFPYSSKTKSFYQMLGKFHCSYASICTDNIPLPPILVSKKIMKLDNWRWEKLAEKYNSTLLSAQPNWMTGVIGPRYVVRGGRNYTRNYPTPEKDTEIIWAHSLDYNVYLKNKFITTPLVSSAYSVFLDEYYPFHPDYELMPETNPRIDPDSYYEGLNRFFRHIEQQFKVEIVVAIHPRSNYETAANYFEGRRCLKDKTAELVAGAQFVLAQSSTSINFAVIYRKPVIFLTSDAIESNYHGPIIRFFAQQFRKGPINIDRNITQRDLRSEIIVEQDVYDTYFADYIKMPGSPERISWDILADHIERLPSERK